jgi:hypothetical protein
MPLCRLYPTISNASVARAVVSVHLDAILSTGVWDAAIAKVLWCDGMQAYEVSIKGGGYGRAGGGETVEAGRERGIAARCEGGDRTEAGTRVWASVGFGGDGSIAFPQQAGSPSLP